MDKIQQATMRGRWEMMPLMMYAFAMWIIEPPVGSWITPAAAIAAALVLFALHWYYSRHPLAS